MCILAATTAVAAAKHTPFDSRPAAVASEARADNGAIFMGPAGAMLESDYFRAPQGLFSRGNRSCRLRRNSNGKTLRLAYSCR
jgi:hypothetical protein